MPLPAAQPLNSLGAVPITLPQMVQAPNLQLLTAGLQSGAINQGDLEDQLSKIAVRKHQQVQTAAAQEDLKSLPMRRQQEMQAGQQENQIRDLQIQTAQRQLSNPFLAAEQSNQAKDLADYDEATNYAAKPLDKDGKIDWTAVRMTNRAAKQKQTELDNTNKASLQEDERANAAHQTNFGYIPKDATGAVDRTARDANLKDFGGKQLSEGETQLLGAIDQSQTELDKIEQLFKERKPTDAAPITGLLAKINPYDTSAKLIAGQNASSAQILARGVLREKGNLSDAKIKAVMDKLPGVTDTPEQVTAKIGALRSELTQARTITLDEMAKRGLTTKRFETPSTGAAPTGTPAATPTKGTGQRVLVTSKAQLDGLASGTPIIDAQGNTGVKP